MLIDFENMEVKTIPHFKDGPGEVKACMFITAADLG